MSEEKPVTAPDDSAAQEVQVPDKFKGEDGQVNQSELAKSYVSLESEASRMSQELAQAKKELEAAQTSGKMLSTLEQIANQTKAPEAEPEVVDFEKFCEDHAEEWESNPSKMGRDVTALMSEWQRSDSQAMEKKMEDKFAKLMAGQEALQNTIATSRPEYLEHQARITEVQELYGMTLEAATRFAQDEKASQPPEQAQATPSAAVPGTRTTGGTQVREEPRLSEAEINDYKRRGFSDAEIAGILNPQHVIAREDS